MNTTKLRKKSKSQEPSEKLRFTVAPDGKLTAIYDDRMADFLSSGKATIRRASHVEPNPNGDGWIADMSPSGGPVLGPCKLREQALQLERGWLEAKLFTEGRTNEETVSKL